MSGNLMQLKRPRLGYGYRAESLDEERTLLLSDNDHVLLTGKLYRLVLSAVGEGIPMAELVAGLRDEVSEPEVIYAVNLLARHGYISETHPDLSAETCAFWHGMGLDAQILSGILAQKPVSLESLGDAPMDLFHDTFRQNGIRLDRKGVLRIILTREYDIREIEGINRESMASQSPWMLVNPFGAQAWIGPLFLPGRTGCWACLAQRLRNNRQVQRFYRAVKKTRENPVLPLSFTPMSLQAAAGLAAMEIVKWLYHGENLRVEGKVISLDTASLDLQSHILVRRPQCGVCGNPIPADKPPAPIRLTQKSAYCINKQGGYRERLPEDTIARFRHHVSPITGVAQHLEPVPSDPGAPVYNYNSGNNVALNSSSLQWLNHHMRRFNIGKGRNRSQAKVGALCESIERYSCTWQGDESRIRSSLDALGEEGIHPNACMNWSREQYRNRDEINRDCRNYHQLVPVPFDTGASMEWTPVYSMTEKRIKYLPACFCYANYPMHPDAGEAGQFCYPDTNGNAAGNSLEEAFLQGFLELVERDAVALWWYNRIQRVRVDLESFNLPYFNELKAYYSSLGRSLLVLDITTDLGIPSFAAVSHNLDKGGEIIFAFGAHVDAAIGIERALLEVNQILHVVNVPEKDRSAGKYRTEDPCFLDWLATATVENQGHLVPTSDNSIKTVADYSQLCEPNVYDSAIFCRETAAGQGLETLVLDMTRPDIGLNVVKVVVPGLRHFWKRLGPGRLYEVPVKMGWMDTALPEEALNPTGIFI